MFEQLASNTGLYVVIGAAAVVVALLLWRLWRLVKRRGSDDAVAGPNALDTVRNLRAANGQWPTIMAELAGPNTLETVRKLRVNNAQWPTIVAELNPTCDSKLASLLQELRGPHMFVPHTALNIIEDACLGTLSANPRAGMREILSNARRDMAKVTRHGD